MEVLSIFTRKSRTKPSFVTGILGGVDPSELKLIPKTKVKLDKLDSSGMGLLIFCNEAEDWML